LAQRKLSQKVKSPSVPIRGAIILPTAEPINWR